MRVISTEVEQHFARAFAIAGVAAAVTIACTQRPATAERGPLQRLQDAAPKSARQIEARFSGNFSWAPFRHQRAGPTSEDEADLETIAGEIVERSERVPSAANLRTAGIARALLASFDDSVTLFEQVSRMEPQDGRVWNDLAAARYELAIDRNELQWLPSALSAVDRALLLAPHLQQAHFNRALILTRMGVRGEALEAWRDATDVERDRAWAAEAVHRANTLRQSAAVAVEPELNRCIAASDRGDLAPLRIFIGNHLQDTRTIAETKMLTSWAELVHGNRFAEGAQALQRTQRVVDILAEINGDKLLSDAVETIESTSVERQRQTATAYLAYRDARVAYARRNRNSAADLRNAALLFARLRNPLEHLARYYSANALLDANQFEQSHAVLTRILESIPAARYPSLAAGAEKELGLDYGFRGMWTASLAHLERSQALFTAHREPVNAAFVEATIGEAYDLIGDFGRGWRHRIAALDLLTRSGPNDRSVPVLIGAVHAEIMRHDYESALSLLRVAQREATHVAIPDVTAEMVLSEARVLLIAGRAGDAEAALVNATQVTRGIEEEGIRERLEAEIALVRAAVERPSNPRRAVELVTSAISFFQSHKLDIFLPPAYLERGRAQLACGNRAAARRDFQAGLRWIEWQRANARVDIRTALFDTVPELTSELVDVLLDVNDVAGAYAAVEQARARTLIEALGVTRSTGTAGVDAVVSALPASGAVVEFALLPGSVAAFCIDHRGLTVHRLAVTPEQLRRQIAELRTAIQDRRPKETVEQISARLYDELFRPLEPVIDNATVLYVSLDRFLNATPLPALYDVRTKQYLIEKYRLILVPSANFLLRRTETVLPIRPAFVIADPTSPSGGPRLDGARRAAVSIAALFEADSPLVGRDATIQRFLATAPQSGMIHYSGHAGSDDTAGGFLPLAPVGDSDGRLDATAISQLPLNRTVLVVLSACATMRGDLSRVEGMPSLSRAFLNAHARAVVGMLWEVDDATTASLLAPFHRRLRDGMPPSQALQEAQLEMLRNSRADLRHPATWAAAAFLGVD